MIAPTQCVLLFVPADVFVNAQIVTLTPEMIAHGMGDRWWHDRSLVAVMNPPPIDRDWMWEDVEIMWEGQVLPSEKVAVVTGDGYIQGAMLISSEPVKSELEDEQECLFVELLFTAPHNRPNLRVDRTRYFSGVGPELLRWGAGFCRKRGYAGRLRLDASPEFVEWYAKLGFKRLEVEPVIFESVQYTPMELPSASAQSLIDRLSGSLEKRSEK